MSKLPNDEVYRELFTAKKSLYNDSHDIKIHGIPVELYVQDAREPVVSLGEYSLKNDNWLKIPSKRRANFDQTATKTKYEKLLTLIELALKSRKYSKVSNIVKTIKRYRQSGLDKGGEFGPENLAYKALRAQGYITKLYDLRDKLHSEKLTIETMYQPINDDYDSNDPTYSVNEFSTMRFAAEKTPAINPYGGRKDIQYRGSMSEASGYIPSEKQKNDPRFSTALTVDVHPDSIKKNAKAFGWLTSRAGIPPTAKANGKI
jgi:hypothetical protein